MNKRTEIRNAAFEAVLHAAIAAQHCRELYPLLEGDRLLVASRCAAELSATTERLVEAFNVAKSAVRS